MLLAALGVANLQSKIQYFSKSDSIYCWKRLSSATKINNLVASRLSPFLAILYASVSSSLIKTGVGQCKRCERPMVSVYLLM